MSAPAQTPTQNEQAIERIYRSIASTMNAMQIVSEDEYFYEILSDTLIWEDEKSATLTHEAIWALRPLFHYRTSLIRGARDSRYEAHWRIGQALFPRWIGFRACRVHPPPKVKDYLEERAATINRDLARMT